MMKYKNTIKNIFFASLFLVVFFMFGIKDTKAQNINVEFQSSPLFLDLDTKPGDATTRWVKVTNFTGSMQTVGVQALNTYDCSADPFCLADVLQFEVRQGATLLYQNSLAGFFADGEVVLISQAGGSTEQYDFTVRFPSVIGNDYQKLSTYFDLLVGFVGGSSGGGGGSGDGGSSGGGSSPQPYINIQKSGDSSVVPGLTGYYLLTISNTGSAVAENVVVTDTLPTGFTFVNNGLSTQVWNLGSLQPNEVRIIAYDMNVPVGVVGEYINYAKVSVNGRQDSGYFAEDDFPFTIVQVRGFETPELPAEEVPTILGFETPDQGYDELPTTGGKILSWLGYDANKNIISTNSVLSHYYYLLAIGFYLVVIGLLVLVRKQAKRD